MKSRLSKDTILVLSDVETTGLAPDDVAIEVGLIVVNGELEELDRYHSLIRPDSPGDFIHITDGRKMWKERAARAAAVHKISADDVWNAPGRNEIADEIISCLPEQLDERYRGPLLMSDNAHFEHFHFRHILKDTGWPFHYCTWDSSYHLEELGIGDPPKGAGDEYGPPTVHRALGDVEALLSRLRAAKRSLVSYHTLWELHLPHFSPGQEV